MEKDNIPVRPAIEIAIRLGLLTVLVVYCYTILESFIPLVLWATIIAIALHRFFMALESKVGGRRKLAVGLFILMWLVIILVPALLFSGSIFATATEGSANLRAGTLQLPMPTEVVRQWPVIGERIYSAWLAASGNLTQFLRDHRESFAGLAQALAGMAASFVATAAKFLFSAVVAGMLLGRHEEVSRAIFRLANRLVGDKGDEMVILSAATIRNVAIGFLGVAGIQAVIAGLGFVLAGVPAAGLLALVILVLAIAQLPVWLVLVPAIIFVSAHESTVFTVIFVVWCVLVQLSDTVLKPRLLGRGAKAPVPVITLGAVGGMSAGGVMGLFIGAVILALAWNLFMAWQEMDMPEASTAGTDSTEL